VFRGKKAICYRVHEDQNIKPKKDEKNQVHLLVAKTMEVCTGPQQMRNTGGHAAGTKGAHKNLEVEAIAEEGTSYGEEAKLILVRITELRRDNLRRDPRALKSKRRPINIQKPPSATC